MLIGERWSRYNRNMLFVFYGNDVSNVRTKAYACLHKEGGDTCEIVTITPENISPEVLRDLASAQSLFGSRAVVLIDTLSSVKDTLQILSDEIEQIAASENIFVVAEGTLTEADKKVLLPHATQAVELKRNETARFNIFRLSDALLNRDKKTLWILLNEAWREGITNEEIVGTLLWQLKSMRLVSLTTSSEEAGLKPFVYDKAKRGCVKYKKDELRKLSFELVSLYHDGHTGKRDLSLSLEAWVLKL